MFASIKTSLRFWLVFVVVIATILSACRGSSDAEGLNPSPTINPPVKLSAPLQQYPSLDRHPDIDPAYQPIAENSNLRLYIQQETSAILIEDLRNQVLWRSSPEDLDSNQNTTQAWRKMIAQPIQVSYVDAARALAKNVKPEEAIIKYQPIENGSRVTYDFKSKNLAFDVTYTIQEDCLEATILSDSIVEGEGNNLVAIDLLQFMGATHDTDEGYIVYPDGSGSLFYFSTPHPPEVQKILSTMYGGDDVSAQVSIYQENISMPVFGLVNDQAGFVGMITQGEFDAILGVARSGKGVDYNHVWAQFVFRRQGRFSLTGGQPARLYQPDIITGDRQVRYCFLNHDKANYIEMASRYRQYLLDERGATRLNNRDDESHPYMKLIFFMGIERRNWFLADMILMTTFDEVGEMMASLNAQGLQKADVSLWNWNEGGIRGKYPRRFPVDKRLGGEEGLKQLIQNLHQLGYPVFLVDDYLSVLPGTNEIQPFLDAVRGVDGLPAGNPESGYLLNPQVALREFALPDLMKIAALNADGVLFQHFGFMALPDKNTRYALSRENFAATWMQIADLSRQQLGKSAMIGNNIYTLPHTDRLYMVPLDSTHYDVFDETIPFYQIAIHGLVIYSGPPHNLLSDRQRMFLHQVAYGAIPSFILTKDSSSLLFRTNANNIYSSRFDYWQEEILRQYRAMETLVPFLSEFITGYDVLQPGVSRTTYESGGQVIVNTTKTPYKTDSFSVPAMDFIVIGGN